MARVSASEMTASDLAALAHQADELEGSFAYKPDLDQMSTPYDGEMHLEEAAVAGEGCTLGDVAEMCLRVTAGVVGMPLYNLILGVTALLSICLIVPGVILSLPFAAVGAGLGAAFVTSDAEFSGASKGATVGLVIGGFPLFLAEVVSYLPKFILFCSFGVLSIALTDYAIFGAVDDLVDSKGNPVGFWAMMSDLEKTSFPIFCLLPSLFPTANEKD